MSDKQIRMEYSSGLPTYRAVNGSETALTSDGDWCIWKYGWDGDECTGIEGPLVGSWDGREGLSWGI